jgi:tetratricopeptide (TPR) repeat protein
MAKFIWKVTGSNGQETVERIDSTDARAAREELEIRGLTNLRLQQEEIAEASAEGTKNASNPKYVPVLSAEEEAAYFDGKIPGFWLQWWKSAKENPLWEGVWIILVAWNIYRGSIGWAVVAAIPLLLFPALRFWFGMPSRLYDQINRAKVWSRWPDVFRLANRLERVQSWVRIGAPLWEIARCRGQALAGMDRLEEGVKEFERFEGDGALAPWMYRSHLAGIYDVANRIDEALALRIKASEEMPSNMNVWIDLAMHYAHRMGDLNSARAAFARIDESLVAELGRPYLEIVRGMMLGLEGSYAIARLKFETAIQGFAAYRHNPLIQSVMLLSKSYVCLCCASTGDTREASKLWKEVSRYLEAAREDKLITRIRSALPETG